MDQDPPPSAGDAKAITDQSVFELDGEKLASIFTGKERLALKFVVVESRIFIAPAEIDLAGQKITIFHKDIAENMTRIMGSGSDLKIQDAGRALLTKKPEGGDKMIIFGASTAYGRGNGATRAETIHTAGFILNGKFEVTSIS